MADRITQAQPIGFADAEKRRRLRGRPEVKSSFERIPEYTAKDVCVRTSKSTPLNTKPILPEKLIAPNSIIPIQDDIYGKGQALKDFCGFCGDDGR